MNLTRLNGILYLLEDKVMKDSTSEDEHYTSVDNIHVFNSLQSFDSIVVLIHLLITTFPEDMSSWEPDQKYVVKDD